MLEFSSRGGRGDGLTRRRGGRGGIAGLPCGGSSDDRSSLPACWRFPLAKRTPALWRCPDCGHRFVTRNLWHSCGRYRLADHFAGKPPVLRQTFRRFVATARDCGPVTVYAQKTRIVIQARVRFAGAVVRKDWLDAGIWLRRRVEHARVCRIESFGRLGYGIHFRLTRPSDIDRELAVLVREAYAAAVERPRAREKQPR